MAKKKTKEKLIETALNLIWKDSYGTVSVEDICKSAGVLKGSFYHYFPSKKDLADAALIECRAHFRELYNDIFSPLNPPLERFMKMADHKIEMQEQMLKENGFVMGCPTGGFRQDLSAAEAPNINIQDIGRESLTYYKAALKDMKAEGQIDSDTDIDRRADEIYVFMMGTMATARMMNDLTFMRTGFKPALRRIIGVEKE